MVYTPVPTKSDGDKWTAADHNLYIKDNFAAGAPDIFQAKGDLVVGTAANAAARLPVGADGQVLKCDSTTATGLAWGQGSIVTARQGGSATSWATAGTTTYNPTNPVRVTAGVIEDVGIYTTHTIDVTLPFSYLYLPLGKVNCLNYSTTVCNVEPLTTSTIRIHWRNTVTSVGNSRFEWMVIGEVAP